MELDETSMQQRDVSSALHITLASRRYPNEKNPDATADRLQQGFGTLLSAEAHARFWHRCIKVAVVISKFVCVVCCCYKVHITVFVRRQQPASQLVSLRSTQAVIEPPMCWPRIYASGATSSTISHHLPTCCRLQLKLLTVASSALALLNSCALWHVFTCHKCLKRVHFLVANAGRCQKRAEVGQVVG